ncbi:hypothetical protein NQ317_019089 [Molorchus minor]|uniref:acylaminoacyl-peptidase n=1 Tax=Molorchus minor TaxID=1323400 RepID=A0ABQ9JM02_9CUCU|nr:hypothetical protein NQ317_019089 [Molorchus minor]
MSAKIDKILKSYKSLAQTPTLIAANIRPNGIISTTWSQRNLEKGQTMKFVRDIFITDLNKSAEGQPVDISTELLSKTSDTEKFRAILRENNIKLPLNGHSVKSPIFSPDGKSLVWLQRKAGGPHHAAMQLVKTNLPLTENSKPIIIIDVVYTDRKISNGKTFYGLFNTGFPKKPWASGNRLLLNTSQRYTINSYVVNIDSGEITELEFNNGSQLVMDVYEDKVLAVRQNYFRGDRLFLGKLPPPGSETSITWTEVTNSETVQGLEGFMYKYLDLLADNVEGNNVDTFNAIYLGPKSGDKASVPLIVWPHGGPHSAFANYFILEAALYLLFGFAIVFVNYRGSTGCGQKSIDFLLGKVGSADVSDCITATDKSLERFPWLNANSIALIGASHGGFLVTHLSGQYPDKFKAVIARNPVIDIASMSFISDIPDWRYVEVGQEYNPGGEINNEAISIMRRVSPIVHAHRVKAPTLLEIASNDLRVPPHQGTEYYLRLKANGVVTRMNLYNDNHSLGKVTNEIDKVINGLLWIQEHL